MHHQRAKINAPPDLRVKRRILFKAVDAAGHRVRGLGLLFYLEDDGTGGLTRLQVPVRLGRLLEWI